MKSLKSLLRTFFDLDVGEDESFLIAFITQSEVWDIRQCDVCKHTKIVPYNCNLPFHITNKHIVAGNLVSVLEKNKPVTLKSAFEQFKINSMYSLTEKEFLELKEFLITKKIIDKA